MSVLKIHMTYQCTSECAHCRFHCTRDPAPLIDHALALRCIEYLKEHNGLDLVVLMGGEPGLHRALMYALAHNIANMHLALRVETNAFWADSHANAYKFLKPLYECGASMMFSLDAFHEPFVPPRNVENAIRVSDDLDGRYSLETAYVNHGNHVNEWDARTDMLLAELKENLGRASCCDICKGNVVFNGRAARQLSELVSMGRGVPRDTCRFVPWWPNGSLETLDLLILDPYGYLSKGCGIAIGNIMEEPIESILESFSARDHPLFSRLLSSGPAGLLREAEDAGYVRKEDYADKCHLCQEVRDALREHYRTYLVPKQHYRQ